MMNPGATPSIEVAHQLGFCHLLNQSDCTLTEREHEFTVLVYNPASVPLSSHVRLPIGGTDEPTTSVVGPDGEKIESQVVQLAPHRHAIPEVLGNATSSLVFQVKVEPLGASLYHVKREPPAVQVPEDFLQVDEPANFIENERFRVVVNPETGLVSSVVLLGRQLTVQLRQTFGAYLFAVKAPGNMSPPGHYVFSAYREAEDMGDQVTYRIVKGPVVQEIHQIFNGFVSQIIAIHKDSPYIEFTWTVGPLTELLTPSIVQSSTGCDVVSRFDTDLGSEGFHTDGNGWRNMRRTVTFHKDKLPIPANYYPVTSWIYIEDKARDLQMLVVPDRPQGGTSLRKGHLELMVHRRHATNDELGNPEFLLETGNDDQALVAKGTHRLFLGSRAEVTSIMRLQALQLVYRPLLVFAPAGWRPRKKKFSALRQPLPSTVHVLTLEMLPAHEVLLRLEHLATNDTTVKISITRLLAGCRLENVRPTTLGANRFLPGPKRHRWRTQEEARGWKSRFSVDDVLMAAPEMTTESSTGDKHVNLRPGQIATFLAKLVAE
ncbi:lysosomal alpha-mannosidase-like [Dermacentor silvarum]|uniref:lysosomal alpha-mannosidase-like n=1 Tax=Dermacentor silvarum TaxID=543639 RepID=UPI00189BEC02|nr:lysosomal alpha-mannosidase-like [Dermacentor silvarum]